MKDYNNIVRYRIDGSVIWGWEKDTLTEEKRLQREKKLLEEVVRCAEENHPYVNTERFGSVLTAVDLRVVPEYKDLDEEIKIRLLDRAVEVLFKNGFSTGEVAAVLGISRIRVFEILEKLKIPIFDVDPDLFAEALNRNDWAIEDD